MTREQWTKPSRLATPGIILNKNDHLQHTAVEPWKITGSFISPISRDHRMVHGIEPCGGHTIYHSHRYQIDRSYKAIEWDETSSHSHNRQRTVAEWKSAPNHPAARDIVLADMRFTNNTRRSRCKQNIYTSKYPCRQRHMTTPIKCTNSTIRQRPRTLFSPLPT